MSTNIHFVASRNIIVEKTGVKLVQRYYLHNVVQTPSDVTRMLMRTAHPIQAYIDWCENNPTSVIEPVFAKDDIFCEFDPIGQVEVFPFKESAEKFKAEIKSHEDDGWVITAEAW